MVALCLWGSLFIRFVVEEGAVDFDLVWGAAVFKGEQASFGGLLGQRGVGQVGRGFACSLGKEQHGQGHRHAHRYQQNLYSVFSHDMCAPDSTALPQ